MTQEQKKLLLKDLCPRLPYGVKASTKVGSNIIVSFIGVDTIIGEHGDSYDISFITPYLFPMSSMTEEQKEDMIKSSCGYGSDKNVFDWYNKNHFDYRGLIPMGFANDATGLNIY